jgi:hypothetical protein
MPLTFLSHQAVVLPLKIAAPARTSGTALVLGSMAPDVEYFIRTYPTTTISHNWVGLIVFCLPVTLASYWVVTRLVAEPLALHLPDGGDFRLSEYALLREQPNTLRHWGVVAGSGLVGSASHLVLDRLSGFWSTLPIGEPTSWLPREALPSSEAWIIAKLSTWILLALVSVVLMRHIGRRRLLRQWIVERRRTNDETGAKKPTRSPTRSDAMEVTSVRDAGTAEPGAQETGPAFWTVIVAAAVVAGALGIVYRRSGFHLHQPATWVHVGLCVISGAFVGLVLASAMWQRRITITHQPRGGHS